MRDVHRSILRTAGHVVAGLSVGAVCGFALLSLRFVAANQFPAPGVAMIVVLVAALAGAVAAGLRLWRQRPAPATARRPARVVVRDLIGEARPSLRRKHVQLQDAEPREEQPPVIEQSHVGISAVPDAA